MLRDKMAKIVDFFSSGCHVSEDHEIIHQQEQVMVATFTSLGIGQS